MQPDTTSPDAGDYWYSKMTRCLSIPIDSSCKRQSDDELPKGTLDAIVRAYVRDCRPRLEAQLRSFSDEPTLQSALSRAALAQTPDGKRYSHQYRIKVTVLQTAHRRLLGLNLLNLRCFDELHAVIDQAIGTIFGAGELLVYDTSLRIGAKLGVMPDLVYLHRGARRGARALGLPWKQRSISVKELPEVLRNLKPHEIEDCLCIFKSRFSSL